jgi:GT2 family glycosyltransferase
MKKKLPRISLVITNWNLSDKTINALNNIQNYFYPNDLLEIIVIDNNSLQEQKEKIKQFSILFQEKSKIKTIYYGFDTHPGVTASYNKSLELINSESKYIIRHDNDVTLTKFSLLKMILHLENNPSIGIIGPKLFYASCPTLTNTHIIKVGVWGSNAKIPETKGASSTDAILGALMVFRLSGINKVGYLFNPKLFLFAEELDIGYKIKKLGYEIIYYPYAIGYHETKVSLGKHTNLSHYLNLRNHSKVLLENTTLLQSIVRTTWIIIIYAVKYFIKKDKIGLLAIIDSLKSEELTVSWWNSQIYNKNFVRPNEKNNS